MTDCLQTKTIEYPRRVTHVVLNGENCNTQYGRSIKQSPTFWAKEPIPNRKFIASLQLSVEVLVAGWSSLRNKLVLILFKQNKQHLLFSCYQISLLISNMKFNCKFGKQFWRIWFKVIGSALACLRGSEVTFDTEASKLVSKKRKISHWSTVLEFD